MFRRNEYDLDDWDVDGYGDVPQKRQVRKHPSKKQKTSKKLTKKQLEQQSYGKPMYNNIDGYNPYANNPYSNMGNNPYDNNQSNQRIDDDGYHDSRLDEIRKDRDIDDGTDKRILDSLNRSIKSNSVYGAGYDEYTGNNGFEYDNYGYDYDDDDYELDTDTGETKRKIIKIILSLLVVIGAIGLFIFWGYWNTDFDDNGTAYIVPLEQHYERRYLKEADKVLSYIIEIDSTLTEDTAQLPSSYSEMSTKLTKEMNTLTSLTTSFSKYVNVPDNFQTYHSLLINFSLKTQEFMKNLLNNYASTDYEAFRTSGLQDYEDYFYQVKEARKDLDSVAFSNMSKQKGLLDKNSDTSTTDSTNNSSSDSSSSGSTTDIKKSNNFNSLNSSSSFSQSSSDDYDEENNNENTDEETTQVNSDTNYDTTSQDYRDITDENTSSQTSSDQSTDLANSMTSQDLTTGDLN